MKNFEAKQRYSSSRSCPKCGSSSVGKKYRDIFDDIERECNSCGYFWYEKTLDSE